MLSSSYLFHRHLVLLLDRDDENGNIIGAVEQTGDYWSLG